MPLHDVLRQRLQPLTSTVTSNRIFLYSVFSTFAVAATIANACRAHSNFYSVSIYLAKSSRSVLILANFGFLCALLSGRIFQRIFFGPLQPREVERLYDQTWMFVTESLLAFTIFRDEFDVPFLLMFGFLLFVKCFHWLMADRVESMDQTPYPGPPTLFHVRINALFGVLWAIDITMFAFAVESTLTNGVGGMVLFASEYAILLASALNAMLRYALSILDLRRARTRGGENAPPWENKSMYIFYIELLTDFLKLATYMTFFMIILTFYGLPLNIIRDVFVTARSFITRLRALVRYHNATRDMDRRYPDATEAELVEMSDRTCIICREEMHSRAAPAPAAAAADHAANGAPQQPPQSPADGPNMTPKKLPCGHIFHFQCLRSWLERQQSCPTCRRTVLDNNTPQNAQQAPGQAPRQQGAARPRPGAAPVPGVAPGGAVAGNGPLGWVGRFLGLPQAPALNAQFPGAQGQAQAPFAQGQHQQQPGFPPPPPGWFQAPAGFPPQQFQRQPDPNAFADYMQRFQHDAGFAPQRFPGDGGFAGQPFPPPQFIPMQQPPPFNGFWGPQNAWQPWGDPRAFGQQPPAPPQPPPGQQHEQEPAPTQPQQVPRPPSVAAPTGEAAIPQGAGSQAPTPTPTASLPSSFTSETNTSAVNAGNMDARRAAALAAFRRLNPNAAAEAPAAPAQTTEPGSSAPPAEAAIASSSTSTAPSTPAVAEPSAPAPTPTVPAADAAPGQPQPTPTTQTPGHLPPLIPLYDTSLAPPPRLPGAPSYAAPYNYTHPAYNHFYRAPALHPSAPRPSASASAQSQNQIPRSARAGPGGSRTPLGQLPPTLTEDQLARLDRLTREAIDERLRVLEGVSGAVYRCMEELTRVRSVLPMPARRAGQQAGGSSSSAAPAPTPAVDAGSEGSSVQSRVPAKDEAHEASAESSESATPSEDGSTQSETGEANGTALDAHAREVAES